ncbi:MAG: beta-ketoacyl reductase, partial [Cyclobacteriaceae bacterium]
SGGLSLQSQELAMWLARCGAQSVVITDCEQQPLYQESTIGENTTCIQSRLNTTDRPQVEKLWHRIHKGAGGVRGIFILPRSMEDGVLNTITVESLKESMFYNTQPAWNLHEVSVNTDLTYFVCFSSNAAVLGSPGQINYAASNAFLDQLVHLRRQSKMPGVSINWGPWLSIGAASKLSEQGKKHILDQGWQPLETDIGFSALDYIMQDQRPQIAVLPVSWEVLIKTIPDYVKPFYSALVDTNDTGDLWSLDDINNLLKQASPADRPELVLSYIQKTAAKISGYPETRFKPNGTLLEFGVDSLMAVMVGNRIKSQLQIKIPLSNLIDGSNLHEIVNQLVEKWNDQV